MKERERKKVLPFFFYVMLQNIVLGSVMHQTHKVSHFSKWKRRLVGGCEIQINKFENVILIIEAQ
jgi:hypothetical protein